jgi:hypothetical protein
VVDANARYAPENWLQRDASFPARGFDERTAAPTLSPQM